MASTEKGEGKRQNVAITRPVPDALADCELTHLARVPIDIPTARRQHADYERALVSLGCEIVRVPAADDLPDSVFVEDLAIVLDEVAIVTRPGAASRRGESAGVSATLGAFRQLAFITAPATLDGGDVLRLGRVLYVGLGTRTNAAGVQQMTSLVAPYGYEVRSVSVDACLHLKSAITEVAPGVVLLNPAWIEARNFADYGIIEVAPSEAAAANVLRLGNAVLCAAAYENTNARLSAFADVHTVDVSELAKAEGAVTCCSLLISR